MRTEQAGGAELAVSRDRSAGVCDGRYQYDAPVDTYIEDLLKSKKLWKADPRLYRGQYFPTNTHFISFCSIVRDNQQVFTLRHRSNLMKLAHDRG